MEDELEVRLTKHPGLPKTVPVLARRVPLLGEPSVPGHPRLVAPPAGTASRPDPRRGLPRAGIILPSLTPRQPLTSPPAVPGGPGGVEGETVQGSPVQSRAHSSTRCLEGSHARSPTQHAEECLVADFGPRPSEEIALCRVYKRSPAFQTCGPFSVFFPFHSTVTQETQRDEAAGWLLEPVSESRKHAEFTANTHQLPSYDNQKNTCARSMHPNIETYRMPRITWK